MTETTGGCVQGFAAAVVFSMTAVVLTAAAYMYGALFGIAPDFPFILTGTFLTGAFLVLIMSPATGRLLTLSEAFSWMGPRFKAVIGASMASAAMIVIWMLTATEANPFDWPGMLYFLQLLLPGAAAGIAIGFSSGGLGEKSGGAAARTTMACLAAFLVVLALPFLPLWLAKRDFQFEAARQAARYFQLPPGIAFETADEGSTDELLQANVRFRASGTVDESGRTFSVNVIGERHRFSIDVKEIYAHAIVPGTAYIAPGDWSNLAGNPQEQKAILDLARSYCNVPLGITSVDARETSASSSMTMRGDGLEVTARPGGGAKTSSSNDDGLQKATIDYSFVARSK